MGGARERYLLLSLSPPLSSLLSSSLSISLLHLCPCLASTNLLFLHLSPTSATLLPSSKFISLLRIPFYSILHTLVLCALPIFPFPVSVVCYLLQPLPSSSPRSPSSPSPSPPPLHPLHHQLPPHPLYPLPRHLMPLPSSSRVRSFGKPFMTC